MVFPLFCRSKTTFVFVSFHGDLVSNFGLHAVLADRVNTEISALKHARTSSQQHDECKRLNSTFPGFPLRLYCSALHAHEHKRRESCRLYLSENSTKRRTGATGGADKFAMFEAASPRSELPAVFRVSCMRFGCCRSRGQRKTKQATGTATKALGAPADLSTEASTEPAYETQATSTAAQ